MSASRNLLAEEPLLDVRMRDIDRDLELRHLVCCVYVRALESLPALVRQWWTALDKRSSDLVCTYDDDDDDDDDNNTALATTLTPTTTITTTNNHHHHYYSHNLNNSHNNNNTNKMLSYCRETALQVALVLAKSRRLELGDNILLTL